MNNATKIPQDTLIINKRSTCNIFGSPIDTLNWQETIATISDWADKNSSKYVCICNVHSIITATQDKNFSEAISQADMATPDGAPIAWLIRKIGNPHQQRINGPDLMLRYCEVAARKNEPIYLYGNTHETLETLKNKLIQLIPNLKIAGAHSPPFRNLTIEEKNEIADKINTSGARTVWVSLGCPKQEFWMVSQKNKIQAVMIGVGAAFDYHAGTINRAPLWMQNLGLEWLHRLASEPRRLWKRYLTTNTQFIIKALPVIIKTSKKNKS